MQVKCEVFSRFGNSVDFSSGEPLGGVEASTVGADLCVRPSSPECSLFCGRTRRSAPTQATSARQFHSSNAVTSICRDARSVRPSPVKARRRQDRSTTDAPARLDTELLGIFPDRVINSQSYSVSVSVVSVIAMCVSVGEGLWCHIVLSTFAPELLIYCDRIGHTTRNR